MPTRFLHTADWQLGKPFAGIESQEKRILVQQERIACISRIAEIAKAKGAEFVVIAGDLFDSSTANKSTVSAACSAIGKISVPVLVIPGNHDHGGPDSIWEQEFFLRERKTLAPNLQILLKAEPVELETAIIFPCPLMRRAESKDVTEWLRAPLAIEDSAANKPRIVLAHGSTQGFSSANDDETGSTAINQIDLSRLPRDTFDYIALGDWHGTKQIDPYSWYSGTPEPDRFPKGDSHFPGHVLIVEVARGELPKVEMVSTAGLKWHPFSFDFSDDASVEHFQRELDKLIEGRAGRDLVQLELTGSLGIEAATKLDKILDSLEARLLRIKLQDRTVIAPTEAEIEELTLRADDPLIAKVATQLVEQAVGRDEAAAIARVALRELHGYCQQA